MSGKNFGMENQGCPSDSRREIMARNGRRMDHDINLAKFRRATAPLLGRAEEIAMARQIVWGIFDHPADYPDGWIAQEFEIWPGEFRKTEQVMTAPTQDALHALLKDKGLIRSRRFSERAALKEAWR